MRLGAVRAARVHPAPLAARQRGTAQNHKIYIAATFLKLADGRGFVLSTARATNYAIAHFSAFRMDTVDESGQSLLRWVYAVDRNAESPIEVHASPFAACAPATAASDAGAEPTVFSRPLAPGTMATICEQRFLKPKGAFASKVCVGKLVGGNRGWILIDPSESLKLIGVKIERSSGSELDHVQTFYAAAAPGDHCEEVSHAIFEAEGGGAVHERAPTPPLAMGDPNPLYLEHSAPAEEGAFYAEEEDHLITRPHEYDVDQNSLYYDGALAEEGAVHAEEEGGEVYHEDHLITRPHEYDVDQNSLYYDGAPAAPQLLMSDQNSLYYESGDVYQEYDDVADDFYAVDGDHHHRHFNEPMLEVLIDRPPTPPQM